MVDGSASGSTTHEQVQAVTTLRSGSDEYQILYIWTPWFTLVRPLALLFYDDLVSFCVFMFCRSISEEWQIHVELLGKFGSSEELDRSNLNSIDRILPEVDMFNFVHFVVYLSSFCP
jgi:hypothetical protein